MASFRRLAQLGRQQACAAARPTSTNVEREVAAGSSSFSAYMKALPVVYQDQPWSAYMHSPAKVSGTHDNASLHLDPMLTDRTEFDAMTSEDMDSLASPKDTPWRPSKAHVGRALPDIVRGTRFRKSCYFDATVESGVQKFVTYNHMLLPSYYHKREYECLRNDVCLWDVAAQRQVELVGPDALKLAQLITPRELGKMKIGDCLYAITTDTEGIVTNDPIVLKVADDRFWFSVADSDLELWVKGIAWALAWDVKVQEAAVSPCALQGPKSVQLLEDLFGPWVGGLKYYKFREVELDGIPILLARSGWSPERGYELYLMDESRGNELWRKLMDAGKKYGIKPGCPNQARRIEGGMLSYGADIKQHNALELGLPDKLVMKDGEFIGKQALQELKHQGGAKRLVVGFKFACAEPLLHDFFQPWKMTNEDGEDVGTVTSFAFSPTLSANIGIATVKTDFTTPGTKLLVETPGGGLEAVTIEKLPFMKRM